MRRLMPLLPMCRKLADGLFLNTCRDVAKEYADTGITFDDMIVDNTAMQVCFYPTWLVINSPHISFYHTTVGEQTSTI